MKTLLTIFSFLLAAIANAQTDWWGVQPAAKNYFTNEDHYLRGMSVDSVKTVGSNTVVYPFKSARGYYMSTQKLRPSGSWLGETITIAPDGTHYFDNFWGDTVIVKTRATLNDSWELFNDTTSIHYTATVTNLNTATVLGSQDSIKEITITAWEGTGVNSIDPLHNTSIILSKAHGFVRVPDLFIFPMHEPNGTFQRGFDYWLDRDLPSAATLSTGHLYFDLVAFNNPKNSELYNFDIGDVFEYKADGVENVSNSQLEKLIVDQIADKTVSATTVDYKIARWIYTKNYKSFPPSHTTIPSFVNVSYNAALLIDTTLMPEEWGQKDLLRYNPADTSFCMTGPLYERLSINIKTDSSIVTMNPCGSTYRYKQNLGRTWYSLCWDGTFGGTHLSQLLYTNKNGDACGNYYELSVASTARKNGVSIYPNPASNQLFVNLPSNHPATVTLHNSIGHQVKQMQADGRSLSIDVTELPAGLYQVIISQKGERIADKVLIEH